MTRRVLGLAAGDKEKGMVGEKQLVYAPAEDSRKISGKFQTGCG
jgi:hypothetical protein